MRLKILLLSFFLFSQMLSHAAIITGQLNDSAGEPVSYANVVLYNAADSIMTKVEVSDENGAFALRNIDAGSYFLKASFVGLSDLVINDIELTADQELDLGVQQFPVLGIELEGATVTATRAMVEIKPDRTVFNVQGTLNSTGSDALSLLRKAPSVTVDNNDNISVLGRAGVLLYVDGKRLPLNGEQLRNYLQSLPAEQIDRIDIITNPGARYEAEGNAGIIDIRLKRDKSLGANGTVSGTASQGELLKYNLDASANYRNKLMNVFGSVGGGQAANFNKMSFENYQNLLLLDESNRTEHQNDYYSFRLGTDFFIAKNHTVGFLVNGFKMDGDENSENKTFISTQANPTSIDSVLIANNTSINGSDQSQFNVNYRYDNQQSGNTINIDLDYGKFKNDNLRQQPNFYYDASEENLLSKKVNSIDTPTEIDIYTFKVDYETKLAGGQFGVGTKLSQVISDNTFLFYNILNDEGQINNQRSNIFDYDENVYAGYLSYGNSINQKWAYTLGLRAEQTDATGSLQPYDPSLAEDPVELNYLSWFPSAGITWQVKPMHSLALNYGRRINRPDYNILNPFENQMSELSYIKGNPTLNPEIVNNIELGYTLFYRYNFKLGYSKTTDQITRLIAPDDEDLRAGYISWDNLASQTIFSFNASMPFQIKEWWSLYCNAGASFLDNQADYGAGNGIVDLQAFTYSIYQQHSFTLPKGFKGEISGYYSGPGVWGGVFEYESSWSLDVGLQKKFFKDQLNVRVSASDLFYESGWNGFSEFNGLRSVGEGAWDSRRVALSLSYNFGNQNVKSRNRKTGLEEEADRVGGEN